MSQKEVPIYDSLKGVYGPDSKQQEQRYAKIQTAFESCYQCKPDFFSRAPGRVNLIGEHIDYSGYGVLPMALEQDVVTAVRLVSGNDSSKSSDKSNTITLDIQVSSTKPSVYGSMKRIISVSFEIDANKDLSELVQIDQNQHTWSNYVLCGVKGIFSLIKVKDLFTGDGTALKSHIELLMMIDGNVPTGSGLSSSSALVCSTSLAVTHAFVSNQLPLSPLSKIELARLTASFEQFIGVQSGGMDQAISFLGKANVAQYITFEPSLANQEVHLPEGIAFIVTHTLVSSNKKETAAINYNKRVVECRLACVLLANKLLNQILPKAETLNWLQKQMQYNFDQMIDACKKYLKSGPYTMKEVADEINMTTEQLKETYFSAVTKLEQENELKLQDRAIHVFSEASRVIEFRNVCNTNGGQHDRAKLLGDLMTKSHLSCRDKYEASCPELEQLTQLAISTGGCLGSRLTGAGWGGCAVSLVQESSVESFCDKLWQAYYVPKCQSETLKIERSEVLFASKPANGAAIIQF